MSPRSKPKLRKRRLAHSARLRRLIQAGLRDIKAGRTIPLEDYKWRSPSKAK